MKEYLESLGYYVSNANNSLHIHLHGNYIDSLIHYHDDIYYLPSLNYRQVTKENIKHLLEYLQQ